MFYCNMSFTVQHSGCIMHGVLIKARFIMENCELARVADRIIQMDDDRFKSDAEFVNCVFECLCVLYFSKSN